MGCTASKLDNEDTVRRCKERRRLMKEAVYARHHLAAAHSDYCRSLRITGSALTAFASGEPFSVSDQTPAVFLRTPSSVSRVSTIPPPLQPPPRVIPSPSPSVQPPPPPPAFSPSSSPTIASSKLPHILTPPSQPPSRRQRKPIKLPHILSESSLSSSPQSHNPARSNNYASNYAYKANSTYSSTPSQSSSVWNWENFYPPSPPDSEFFHRRNNDDDRASAYSKFQNHHIGVDDDKASIYSNYQKHHNPHQIGVDDDKVSAYSNYQKHHNSHQIGVEDDKASAYSNYQKHHNSHQIGVEDDNASAYSNYQKHHNSHQIGVEDDKASAYSNYQKHRYHHHIGVDDEKASTYSNYPKHHNHHIEVDDEEETEREEVQYSEWDDHYNTTTSSEEEDNDGDRDSRSEMGRRSNLESSVHIESKVPPAAASKFSTMSKSDDAESSVSWNAGGKGGSEISDLKIVVRHRNLAEIVAALKENFDKAASAGDQVSELLETSRAQLDRSFRKLKKTVYHSSGVFSNLSSSWTSKPPLAVKYRLEPGSMEEPDGQKSLCSALERLLAWEKKLYQEVKSREGVKIEHEKKLSALQSQEYRGDDEAKLDKTKAAINKLHSLIVVTSQAVSTTSSAIVGLRDSELIPQLSNLCHGFMYMWRSMNQFHEVQSDIVQQVRGLVNRSAKGESTSDLHRQATRDLESAVSAWHSSFCRLVKFQRELICSLHGWFRLTLFPVNSEPTNTNREHSAAFSFFDEWKLALDRIPDTVASEAIKSFINVVHSISMKQAEELKIKRRTESASKELEKKASSLRNIEKKYYHSYSMVGIGLPDMGPNNNHALDARDPLAEKKLELAACQRRVEDEMSRHSKAIEVTRAMTLNNIQTGLPGVFQAMTSFSALIVEALETVCTRSYDMSR